MGRTGAAGACAGPRARAPAGAADGVVLMGPTARLGEDAAGALLCGGRAALEGLSARRSTR